MKAKRRKTEDGRQKTEFGHLKTPSTLVFRQDCGIARDEDGIEYELSINILRKTPIVRSQKTGRWFFLSWKDIVRLAVNAGVNEEEVTR
ncbi:MAG: hypothetical protein HZA88_00455 [Verrucomicrobia bacterium]|nr:hypothetical protein [Verrucomicrobiota bacterium]